MQLRRQVRSPNRSALQPDELDIGTNDPILAPGSAPFRLTFGVREGETANGFANVEMDDDCTAGASVEKLLRIRSWLVLP